MGDCRAGLREGRGEGQGSTVKECLTVAADGKKYLTQQYKLDLILLIGLRVRSPRGTQFRQWALTPHSSRPT